jgi:hypothetical protein
MANTNDSATRTVSVPIKLTLQPSSTGEKAPTSEAYAFTNTGRFLARAAVSSDGSAVLTIPAVASARDIRVVAGPSMTGEQAPTLSDLTRRGASEQFVRIAPGAKVSPVTFDIGSEIWRCWFRRCTVQGTLLKSVITGGLPIDMPVCGATVQIWEVESFEIILPKLPISIIDKIRQMVINPALTNPPNPGPPVEAALSAGVKYAQPVPTISAAPMASAEFPSLQILAQTTEGEAFRRALTPYIPIILPWLCELIPLFITKTLVGTVTTDRCGHFEDVIFLGCYAPNPNIYFTASVPFLFGSISIYAPTPIACYTHWGYACGTNVTLYTSSIFAPVCAPCAPVNAAQNYVLFRAIGGVELNSIYGASPLLPATPLGLAAGAVVSGEDSPFGGLLLPRVEFDSSLLEDNLASYYQISYWDTTLSKWVALTGDIYRHYNEFVGTQLVTKPYSLGPQTVGTTPNLFAIPPALPPAGDWAFPNPPYDLANAQFPTTALPSGSTPPTFGFYQLKLDLYDASGNPVNITTAGIKYYVPSTVESDGTIDTVDASTLGLVSGNSFIMSLYIDNRPTQALLPGVSTPVNSTATDPCGILGYNTLSDIVDIQYVAYQPGNFIDWDLDVVRGTTGSVAAISGHTSAGAPMPGSPVDFDNTVATLIGSCPQAAFGVNLDCYSRCTDGWSRLSGYDSSQSIAFALTVPCPPCPPPNRGQQPG